MFVVVLTSVIAQDAPTRPRRGSAGPDAHRGTPPWSPGMQFQDEPRVARRASASLGVPMFERAPAVGAGICNIFIGDLAPLASRLLTC